MAEEYLNILSSFVKDRLGGLAGNLLLAHYLKEVGIDSLTSLDEKNFIRFSDYFIYHVFKNHLNRQDIDSIRLQLNLQYCFTKAAEKIRTMLDTDIKLKPIKLKIEDKESLDMILNSLTKDITALTINIHGYMKGTFLFFIFKESAINLANMMMKSMLGRMPEDETNLTEIKEDALKEFMNIVIPTFMGTVSNTLGKDIRYRFGDRKPSEVAYQIAEAVSLVNRQEDGKDVVKKILSTNVELSALGTTIQGVCFFLLEDEGKTLSSSIHKSGIKKDKILASFDTERIRLNSSLPIKDQLTELLDQFFPGDGKIRVEGSMNEVSIGGFSKLSVGMKQEFADSLIRRNFQDYADSVILFVKKMIGNILGTQLVTKAPGKNGQEQDVIGKMIRN